MSIFKKHFVYYICAPRNSGKSVLLRNCLIQEELLCGQFDKVYIFSPTIKLQHTFDDVEITSGKIYDSFDREELDKIIKQNMVNMEDILICFDDCIASDDFKKSKASHPLNEISSIGRHQRISMIILSQRINNGSTPLMRDNCDYISLFECSEEELKTAYKHWGSRCKNFEYFKQLYEYCTTENHHFLLINKVDKKFYHNFNELEIK